MWWIPPSVWSVSVAETIINRLIVQWTKRWRSAIEPASSLSNKSTQPCFLLFKHGQHVLCYLLSTFSLKHTNTQWSSIWIILFAETITPINAEDYELRSAANFWLLENEIARAESVMYVITRTSDNEEIKMTANQIWEHVSSQPTDAHILFFLL